METITNHAEENVNKKVKVDFQYFIQSVLQKNISWNSLAISLTDLAPTLDQSRQVIKILVHELEKWVTKAENEAKSNIVAVPTFSESITQDPNNQDQASEFTKSVVLDDVKTKDIKMIPEPVSENESIHDSTLESENISDHIKGLHCSKAKVTTVKSEENMEIQCNECGKTFDKDRIKLHIQRVHLKHLEFSCDQCEFLTSEKRFLLGHKQRHHEERFKFGPQRCEKCLSYRCICKLKRHNEVVHQQTKN